MFFLFEQALEIDYFIPIAFCFDVFYAFNRDKPILGLAFSYYFFREDNFFTGKFYILRNKAEGIAEFFAVGALNASHKDTKAQRRKDY